MIQYSLHCSNGHSFDAWFKNAQAFDDQKARGIVSCALCGDAAVDKAPMAPAVARSGQGSGMGRIDAAQFYQMLRAFRHKVVSEADNVGDRFAEEARKIHFNESEQRGIYGQATRDEVAGLLEDGIDVMPLPDLPDEHN